MNIITFDIEEWSLAKSVGYGSAKKYAEYETNLNQILNALDERGFKGTFFCTGPMGIDFPQVVQLIESRGHEIGCHSFQHTWMNKLTKSEAREDTHKSIDALEQCIGKKVLSYRAPAFSIGENNKWMFSILAEYGIENDASIFPATRDFGGFPNFGTQVPCIIEQEGVTLKEFPICTVKVFGKEMAYSGGGYFRLFPLNFVGKEMAKNDYSMAYFHLGDICPVIDGVMSKELYESYFKETGTLKARYMRYLKTNLGVNSAKQKLMKLISSISFENLAQADATIDWDKAPIITL